MKGNCANPAMTLVERGIVAEAEEGDRITSLAFEIQSIENPEGAIPPA